MVWVIFSYIFHDYLYFEADEAKTMMQGVGSRFDFHMHKTLCDLRYVIARSRSISLIICVVVHARYSTSS